LKLNPKNVLEIGCGRGYVLKKLLANGIPAVGMEKSTHCWHTRVVDDDHFILHDLCDIPYPFEDKQFDLCCSFSVIGELPQDKIYEITKEIERISNRNYHSISEIESVYIPPGYGNKLNFGCFTNMFYYGWINIDTLNLTQFAEANKYKFTQMELPRSLPFISESIDLIFSSHFLEHLTKEEATIHLKECYRIMKPSAIMRTAVPDAGLLIDKMKDGSIYDYVHISPGVEKAETALEALYEVLLSNHKFVYDFETMKSVMEEASFTDVIRCDPFHSQNQKLENETFVSHPTLSLVVEVKK